MVDDSDDDAPSANTATRTKSFLDFVVVGRGRARNGPSADPLPGAADAIESTSPPARGSDLPSASSPASDPASAAASISAAASESIALRSSVSSSREGVENVGLIVETTDPAQSFLDPEYSYSYLQLELHELRALVYEFRRADPTNNGLTPEQFRDVAGGFLACKTTSDPTAIFALFDTTNSSRVTLREFLCGYAILCKGSTDTRIRYLFNMFDTHNRGVLGRKQLTAALKLIAGFAVSSSSVPVASLASPSRLSAPGSLDSLSHAPRTPSSQGPSPPLSPKKTARLSPTNNAPIEDTSNPDEADPDALVDEIVDSLLGGEDNITYEAFIAICEEEPNVMSWLARLAEVTGEYIEESVRAASERHVVELSMQREKIVDFDSHPPRLDPSPRRADSSDPVTARVHLRAEGGATRHNAAVPETETPDRDPRERDLGQSVPGDPASYEDVQSSHGGSTLPFLVSYDKLKFNRIIGRGASATVWEGEWLHMPVAIKELNDAVVYTTALSADPDPPQKGTPGAVLEVGKQVADDLSHEAEVLAQIRHPNICMFMCLCVSPKMCIVSELYLGGSVYDFLHNPKNVRRFGRRQAIEMIRDVARGMLYLHSSQPTILHRDLKTKNILLDRAVTHCVICDFGVSRVQDISQAGPQSDRAPQVGTVNTMSPEVMAGCRYTRAADIYSFGIVAWEMWTGHIPFEGLRAIRLMFMVTEGERPPLDEDPFPQGLRNLVEACWAEDPKKRPDLDNIMTALNNPELLEDAERLDKAKDVDAKSPDDDSKPSNVLHFSKVLMDVVHAGDVAKTREMLSKGADVHYSDYDSRTPLHIACAEGHIEVARVLLNAGAAVQARDRWGGTALNDARRCGKQDIVRLLSSDPCSFDSSGALPAQDAVRRGEDVRESLDLMCAVFENDVEHVESLLADGRSANAADYDGRTPLHLAVSEGRDELVGVLLGHGADTYAVDRWGLSPLDEARRQGDAALVARIEVSRAKDRIRSEQSENRQGRS